MDQTNRVLIVGAALLWVFVLLVIILLAWGSPDESIEQLADLAGYLEDHNDTEAKLIITFGGLILALLGAIIVIVEVSPPETGSLQVERIGSGEAHIGTDEVAQRLEEEIQALPHVHQVQASVLARGAKAEVKLEMHVTAEADLAVTTEEACRLTRQLVEERMGVALTRPPQAQLHYRELQVARPQEPSSSTAPAPSPVATPMSSPTAVPSPPEPSVPETSSGPFTDRPPSTEAPHVAETTREDPPAGS